MKRASCYCWLIVGAAIVLPRPAMPAGTWAPLANTAPGAVGTMLLLSDGSVMAHHAGVTSNWFCLRPDARGSYSNGTWTTLASMHDARLYFASDVMSDGRVFVAGGEYGITNGNVVARAPNSRTAEVYDPLTNAWTLLPSSGQDFYDAVSKVVSNGNVLIAPVFPSSSGGTVLFNPTSNAWVTGPNLFRGVYQDEATWVKLPDQSILTIDPFGTNSERYIPGLNAWVNDGNVPVALYDNFVFELGAAFMLADGRAFFLGSTGHTAFYTPTGATNAP